MHLTRREAIQRILAASAMLGAIDGIVLAAGESRIGFDPDLLKNETPWPRLLTKAEQAAATAFADLILPADQYGPAASETGVVDFIDEWISAPYESNLKSRPVIRDGLAWLDRASGVRVKKTFAVSSPEEQKAFLDAVITPDTAENKEGVKFFRAFRNLASAGYFTTKEGWKAIGYTGNIPSGGDFPPPPDAALKHVGLI